MENVYDVYKKRNMVYILPEEYSKENCTAGALCSAVVVANLYYSDMLHFYLGYLDRVPDEIDIYVISSNPHVKDEMQKRISTKKNMHFLKKENRGRDISALLVAFREILPRYRYICFVHDKKAIHNFMSMDTQYWVRNLWDNTLKSEDYIYNVLGFLEKREDIGLLVPPQRIGMHMDDWYADGWHNDFHIVRQLCEELELECDLDINKPVITLGTVFWARTEILNKICSKKWRYGDFPDEPMPVDGTISHGLERILSYAAQDAGKLTGIVMCDSYAASLYVKVQDMMRITYRQLAESFYISQFDQLINYERQKKQMQEAFKNNKNIYLYGAGKYGKRFLKVMGMWGYYPVGFLVSDGHKKQDQIEGYPVWELHEFDNVNAVIAITADYGSHDEMKNSLEKYGIKDYFIAC